MKRIVIIIPLLLPVVLLSTSIATASYAQQRMPNAQMARRTQAFASTPTSGADDSAWRYNQEIKAALDETEGSLNQYSPNDGDIATNLQELRKFSQTRVWTVVNAQHLVKLYSRTHHSAVQVGLMGLIDNVVSQLGANDVKQALQYASETICSHLAQKYPTLDLGEKTAFRLMQNPDAEVSFDGESRQLQQTLVATKSIWRDIHSKQQLKAKNSEYAITSDPTEPIVQRSSQRSSRFVNALKYLGAGAVGALALYIGQQATSSQESDE